MTDDGYLLSQQAVRRTAEAVRRLDQGADGPGELNGRPWRLFPCRPAWYRIVSKVGNGQYTAQRQEWNPQASPPAFQDLTDAHDAEYNRAQTAYDCHASAAGEVNQKVRGWQLCVNGEWVLVIDVGPGASTIPVKLTASLGEGLYTAREQTWSGASWGNKEGTENITVRNLWESIGEGSVFGISLSLNPVVWARFANEVWWIEVPDFACKLPQAGYQQNYVLQAKGDNTWEVAAPKYLP